MAFRIGHPAVGRLLTAAITLFSLGACTLPTNIALKDADRLRAAQTNCLKTNIARLNASESVPETIAQDAAASCHDATERLAAYAVPHASPQERRAFEEDAVRRASSLVSQPGNSG